MRPRRDARGRRPAGPRRSPAPATNREARDPVFRPTACAANAPSAPPTAEVQARSLARTLRMTQLHPAVQRGEAAIAGRLIEHRIALHRGGKGFGVAFLFDFEGIEAGAKHEHELIAQHLTGGAQLAPVAMALA